MLTLQTTYKTLRSANQGEEPYFHGRDIALIVQGIKVSGGTRNQRRGARKALRYLQKALLEGIKQQCETPTTASATSARLAQMARAKSLAGSLNSTQK